MYNINCDHKALLEYLDRRAGDYHRDETDVVYLRDDIKQVRLTSQIDRLLGRMRPEASPREERSFPFGDLRATVRLFEEAILLHFPGGADRGYVVSLEPKAARDRSSFITECENRIQN